MELDTYTDVQEKEKPPLVATEETARELEALGVVVGVTALDDVGENVVDAGPAIWVDEGVREVGVLDAVDTDTDTDALAGPEYPLMELAENSDATRAETEEKGIVSDTSE